MKIRQQQLDAAGSNEPKAEAPESVDVVQGDPNSRNAAQTIYIDDPRAGATNSGNAAQTVYVDDPNARATNNQTPQGDPNADKSKMGLGIAALILGVLAIVLCFTFVNIVCGVLAIIFGAIHIAKQRNGKGLAIAGIVTGAVGIIITFIIIVAMAFMIRDVTGSIFNYITNAGDDNDENYYYEENDGDDDDSLFYRDDDGDYHIDLGNGFDFELDGDYDDLFDLGGDDANRGGDAF